MFFSFSVRAMMWSQQSLFSELYRSSHTFYPPVPAHLPPFPPADQTKPSVSPKHEPSLHDLTPPESEPGEDKPFNCGYPKCSYVTNRRNNLKRHVMTMHERLNSPHFCCGVTFYRKADMRIHNKEFHGDGYVCSWPGCAKHFLRKALLDRHTKIHTGEKPYICSVCQYGTSHKSNLDRHVKIHFKDAPSEKYPDMYDVYKSKDMYDVYKTNMMQGWNGYQAKPAPPQPWQRSGLEPEQELILPDSTTELSISPSRPCSPRYQSLFHSPEKQIFPHPFPSCDLNTISSILLSPIKSEKGREETEMWWRPDSGLRDDGAGLRDEASGLAPYSHTFLQGRDANKVSHTISAILGMN